MLSAILVSIQSFMHIPLVNFVGHLSSIYADVFLVVSDVI